jgi:hypothetical protein
MLGAMTESTPKGARADELAHRSHRWIGMFCMVMTAILLAAATMAHKAIGAVLLAGLATMYCHTGSFLMGFRGGQTDADDRRVREVAEGVARAELKAAAEMAALTAAPIPCDLRFDMLPALPGEGYLYAIEFDTGVVKVGQTVNPRRRLGEHAREAGAFGTVITDYWISEPHAHYLDNETALISFCRDRAPVVRREYFHGIPIDDAVDFALGLVKSTASADASVPR